MEVTLVAGFSPEVASAGGTRAYVESLSRYLNIAGVPHLTVGSSTILRIGKDWCSVPVKKFGSTGHWLAALSINLSLLPISEDSIVHVQRPDDLLPFLLAGIGSVRVCTIHGNPLQGMNERRCLAVSTAYSVLEAAILRRIDRVVFVDDGNASQYLQRYPWLNGRMEVIPNGVDTTFFTPSDKAMAKRRWGANGTAFLYAGRLDPEKRVTEVVQAFRALDKKDCSMLIAGDGRDMPMVRELSEGLPVRFLGTVERAEMPSLLNASDAVILYSAREGLPSVVLEALACGVPVIATPVGAIPEVVRSGETGFIVRNRLELKQAMASVCRGELTASSSIPEAILPYSWKELGPRIIQAYRRAERKGKTALA